MLRLLKGLAIAGDCLATHANHRPRSGPHRHGGRTADRRGRITSVRECAAIFDESAVRFLSGRLSQMAWKPFTVGNRLPAESDDAGRSLAEESCASAHAIVAATWRTATAVTA